MTAWVTLADIGTAAGTLVLAGATFVAVRAAARSTSIAERALLAGQRAVLAPGGPDDAANVQFADGRVFPVGNGHALVQQDTGVIYLAIPLCNVEAGLAMLRGYRLQGEPAVDVAQDPRGPARHLRGDPSPEPRTFSPQQRDLLISTGRAGFWQAALRDPETPLYKEIAGAAETGGRVTVDVLYGDHEGGQPWVTRFVLLPEAGSWRCDATRYWSLPGKENCATSGSADLTVPAAGHTRKRHRSIRSAIGASRSLRTRTCSGSSPHALKAASSGKSLLTARPMFPGRAPISRPTMTLRRPGNGTDSIARANTSTCTVVTPGFKRIRRMWRSMPQM